jgi:hypothetical protein
MEYLTFAQNGQWTLHKALTDPKDADMPGNTPHRSISASTREGRLPEDRGTRGALHDHGGGKRPKPAHLVGRRKWGKPTHLVDSVYEDQNPGVGQ